MSPISSVAPPQSAVAPPPGNHGNKNTKTPGARVQEAARTGAESDFCSGPSAAWIQKRTKLFTLGGTGVNATQSRI